MASGITGRLITRTGMFSLLFIVAMLNVASVASAKEALDVIGAKFDFGYVPFRTNIKHRVTLINTSDSLIKITRVQPGCGCTQMPLKKRELAPGESLEVEIILETGKVNVGMFHKAPAIYTDNLETPRVVMALTGINLKPDDPQPKIRLLPFSIGLSAADPDSSIEIRNGGSSNIFPKLIESPDSNKFAIEMPIRQIPGGASEKITVKMKQPATGTEPTDESFTIEFNDARQSRYTIPISAK